MTKKEKSVEIIPEAEGDELNPDALKTIISSDEESLPVTQEEGTATLVSDEALMGIYGEILEDLRENTSELDGYIGEFAEMVINGGDASKTSTEAFVNLMKIKTDIPDKMVKIADLMTRLKMKEKNTFPGYLASNQSGSTVIKTGGKNARRALLEALNTQRQKEKGDSDNE